MIEVFRDRWLVVIDKASGVPSQSTASDEPGIHEALLAEHAYVGLHHRLDQPTSGLLLFSLDPAANQGLAEAFRNHSARRTYLAVLQGHVVATHWTHALDGKAASTRVLALGNKNGMTAAQLDLDTGRTHQIRRHAALSGHPVIGDRRYGGDAGRAWPRLALHATRLQLEHPVTGQALDLNSPLPTDLQQLWSLAC